MQFAPRLNVAQLHRRLDYKIALINVIPRHFRTRNEPKSIKIELKAPEVDRIASFGKLIVYRSLSALMADVRIHLDRLHQHTNLN